ncbi:hypothetical protein ACFQ6U_14175 [Streptomyces sp. NPDC056465]
MAEQWPTGRFGDPAVGDQARKAPAAASTPAQQAARRAALAAAQRDWLLPDERAQRNRDRTRAAKRSDGRLLHLVPRSTNSQAA